MSFAVFEPTARFVPAVIGPEPPTAATQKTASRLAKPGDDRIKIVLARGRRVTVGGHREPAALGARRRRRRGSFPRSRRQCPLNLAVLRRLALNIAKTNPTKGSIRGKLKRAAWDHRFLATLLAQMR